MKQLKQSTAAVHILPSVFQEKQIHIDLVGAGGTGSQILSGLARLHVALKALGHPEGIHVRVFDPDHVSEANVGRQLFAPTDVGHGKAVILVNRINCWFGLDWEARTERYAPQPRESRNGGYSDSPYCTDIVITCVDTAAARREIGICLYHLRAGCPAYWLDLGNSQQMGQVFLTQPIGKRGGDFTDHPDPASVMEQIAKKSAVNNAVKVALPTLAEVLPELFEEGMPEDDTPSCSLAEALESQDLFVNQHMATWGLQLLWSLFRNGQLTTHGYWINLVTGTVAPVPVPVPKRKVGALVKLQKGATNG